MNKSLVTLIKTKLDKAGYVLTVGEMDTPARNYHRFNIHNTNGESCGHMIYRCGKIDNQHVNLTTLKFNDLKSGKQGISYCHTQPETISRFGLVKMPDSDTMGLLDLLDEYIRQVKQIVEVRLPLKVGELILKTNPCDVSTNTPRLHAIYVGEKPTRPVPLNELAISNVNMMTRPTATRIIKNTFGDSLTTSLTCIDITGESRNSTRTIEIGDCVFTMINNECVTFKDSSGLITTKDLTNNPPSLDGNVVEVVELILYIQKQYTQYIAPTIK